MKNNRRWIIEISVDLCYIRITVQHIEGAGGHTFIAKNLFTFFTTFSARSPLLIQFLFFFQTQHRQNFKVSCPYELLKISEVVFKRRFLKVRPKIIPSLIGISFTWAKDMNRCLHRSVLLPLSFYITEVTAGGIEPVPFQTFQTHRERCLWCFDDS